MLSKEQTTEFEILAKRDFDTFRIAVDEFICNDTF
jgi:hypothetical protein